MRRHFCLGLGILAGVWVVVVPFHYALTRDLGRTEGFARQILNGPRVSPYAFLLVQYVAVPLMLIVGIRAIWPTIRVPTLRGVLVGLSFGMWANTVFLVIPYLGVYPNLPTACIALLLVGGPSAGSQYYLTVLIANALTYPLVGAIIIRHQTRRFPPEACQNCGYNLTGNTCGRCPECGCATKPEIEGQRKT